MSAPPLPEIFGNYVLKGFFEVVPPAGIDWLPQTPGWFLVAIVLAYYCSKKLWRALQYWYRNRYRGEALTRLADLPRRGEPSELVVQVNQLLKITALVAYPRTDVAQLNGVSWTRFLNHQCESHPFDEATSKLLAEGPYRPLSVEPILLEQLLAASSYWITQHRQGNHA
jgi:hypothetical protein